MEEYSFHNFSKGVNMLDRGTIRRIIRNSKTNPTGSRLTFRA